MSQNTQGSHDEPRLTTGVRGLDTVLHGGFLPGSTFLVVGHPGAGKTIISNQICAHQARSGLGAVYITLLAESHGRLVGNLKQLSFFDESVVSKMLHYISGYHVLEEQGFDGLRQLVHAQVTERKARVLVLDGLHVLENFIADSAISFRKFFHELQFLTTLTGCVVLLISSAHEAYEHQSTTYTLVDGILQLNSEIALGRERRFLRVMKYKASDYLHGVHAYEISDDGITVFPRREALPFPDSRLVSSGERLTFGIPRFDAMLRGGVEAKSATFLAGASGTGKTRFGLQFLVQGAEDGQRGLYFGFSESPARVESKADRISQAVQEQRRRGLLDLRWQQPFEVTLDAFAETILDLIRTQGTRRVFIDGVEGLALSSSPSDRLSSFLSVFLNELRALDATVVFSMYTQGIFSSDIDTPYRSLVNFADYLVLLRHRDAGSAIAQELAILKASNGGYNHNWRRYSVTAEGIRIEGEEASP